MAGQFPSAQGFLGNPLLAALPPDQQQNLLQLQQRQAIGQALLQQGLQPLDTSNRQVGGMGYRISPLEGLSKLVNTYVGNKMSMDAMGQEGQLMSQMAAGAYGTDSTAPAVQQQPPVTSAADSSALTGLSAGMGSYSPQPNPQAIGQALLQNNPNTPMATSTTPGPLTLPGRTAAQSRTLAMFAPQAYGAALGAALTPTDTMKSLVAAGVQPGSPQWNQALSNVAFKEGYLPPVQIGANTTVQDPYSGATSTTPAAAPPGYQNIKGTDGKWYAVAIGGGPQAVQGSRAAEAAGASQYQFKDTFDPTSNTPRTDTVFNLATRANSGAAGPAGIQTGPALGATPAANTLAEGAAKQGLALQTQAEGAPMRKAYLEQMDNALGQFSGGAGSDWSLYAKSMINRSLPDGMQPFDPKSIASQEDFNKQATQYALQQFQTLGSAGSDNSMQTTLHANPNQLLSNMGNHQIVQLLKGNEDAVDVKNRAYQQWLSQGNSPKDYGQFQTLFNQRFDPRVFQSVYMAPNERSTLIQGMTPAEQQAFRTKYNYAVQNGWIPDPRGGQ
ncbi:hypothetical protein [Paraburkholderia caffeinilytica]|uniref:hypothetical protein n=1 Tax=Paraburkholderia caffeinilytica TaxID=1761016 RepID=UPI003DA0DFD6